MPPVVLRRRPSGATSPPYHPRRRHQGEKRAPNTPRCWTSEKQPSSTRVSKGKGWATGTSNWCPQSLHRRGVRLMAPLGGLTMPASSLLRYLAQRALGALRVDSGLSSGGIFATRALPLSMLTSNAAPRGPLFRDLVPLWPTARIPPSRNRGAQSYGHRCSEYPTTWEARYALDHASQGRSF